MPCFYIVVNFTAAASPAEALAKYDKPLPAGWTAGVMNHGEYIRWWLIDERPLLFYSALVGLSVSVLWLWGVGFWAWKRSRNSPPTLHD